MSRGKLKSRDKIVQKMSRDGLMERNITTGEDINISRREADFDIRGDAAGRQPLPQAGTTPEEKKDIGRKAAYKYSESVREAESAALKPDTKGQPPQQQTGMPGHDNTERIQGGTEPQRDSPYGTLTDTLDGNGKYTGPGDTASSQEPIPGSAAPQHDTQPDARNNGQSSPQTMPGGIGGHPQPAPEAVRGSAAEQPIEPTGIPRKKSGATT